MQGRSNCKMNGSCCGKSKMVYSIIQSNRLVVVERSKRK